MGPDGLGEGQLWCPEQKHYDPNTAPQNQVDSGMPGSPHQVVAAKTERNWLLLGAQVFLTGLTTYIAIAISSTAATGYTEGLQIVGFAVFSAPLTILAFLIGLPLRIVPRAPVVVSIRGVVLRRVRIRRGRQASVLCRRRCGTGSLCPERIACD